MHQTKILGYTEFNETLQKLEDRDMLQNDLVASYLLQPYIVSLGYDIYDLDSVARLDSGTTFRISVLEGVDFVFSLLDNREVYKRDDSVRAYIHIDTVTKTIALYYLVSQEWYPIHESRLLLTAPEDISEESSSLIDLNKAVANDDFSKTYGSIGERVFTGSVVDSLLVQEQLNNKFIRTALVEELTNPTSRLINLLADKLTEYSTQNEEWIASYLQRLTETGVTQLIGDAISNEEIDVPIHTKPLAAPTIKRASKPKVAPTKEEAKANIEDKKDLLASAGFGFGAEPKKKDSSIEDLAKQLKGGAVDPKPIEHTIKADEESGIVDISDLI